MEDWKELPQHEEGYTNMPHLHEFTDKPLALLMILHVGERYVFKKLHKI